MYSDKDSLIDQDVDKAIAAFSDKYPTSLLHHRSDCCKIAKEWFVAMDRSFWGVNGPTGAPVWLNQYFEWGASEWGLHWCEAVGRTTLDCGALSALATESFRARGLDTVPVQLIRLHSKAEAEHWKIQWMKQSCPIDWIHGLYAYHEVVAIHQENRIRIWDPTISSWIDPGFQRVYGGTVGIRITVRSHHLPNVLSWGAYRLPINAWQTVDSIPLRNEFKNQYVFHQSQKPHQRASLFQWG
ncbi:MAG: hypothetical protein DDT32_00650 [Syntrophomonadaceae bacterium]|nr:hypothetical protein [Bacillota bacterium]MBT9146903.1 hypothetical protein [Bacillota bacterium]